VTFRIGYRVPDGAAVETEIQHLAIFGLTQKSGKTTSLEAFAERVGRTTITFRTKKGDIGFDGAARLEPYFRERVDWRFIEGLISAQLQEKAQWYRGDIIVACRNAKTVAEVHANVQRRLEKAKSQWTQKALVELNEYLTEIEESLRTHHFATRLEFAHGRFYVVDLEEYSHAMQQLVIASTLTAVLERFRNTIVVLPEARDFIPVDRLTPAKVAIEEFIRKGAAIGNYVWLDSQALTGLDMNVMRNVGLWLFGRQTLDLEVERDLKFLPGRRHAPNEVTGLGLGEFLVVEGDTLTKTYVQPAWMNAESAMRVARGLARAGQIDTQKKREIQMDAEERKGYEEQIRKMASELQTALAKANALEESTGRLQKMLMERGQELHDLQEQLKTERGRAKSLEADAALGAIHRPGLVPPGTRLTTVATDGRGNTTTETRDLSPGNVAPPERGHIDLDALAAKVEDLVLPRILARMPRGAVVEVPPKRAILSAFLEAHVGRVKEPLAKLAKRNKQYLAYLSTKEGWVGTKSVAIALFGYGSDAAEIARSLHEVGAAEYDSQHGRVRYALLENLKRDLQGQYEISDEELAQVHAALQLEFLGMLAKANGDREQERATA